MRREPTPEPPTYATVRAIAEATHRVVWLLTPDGALADDSPSWCSFTGQSPEEAEGHGWRDAIHCNRVPESSDVEARMEANRQSEAPRAGLPW
ncbi:PAS domain-containing protein [Pyxidicoccus caerfyrddinensis]|uniref:PAS domain-containing protein n=1 Tax=Pyxidicoccus caerfyrddinensis TaxID=2709663 RepID=UPI0013DA117C|nr:PAS domain-containing protein [Pyxidicoccus caerfyrddinensis]